MNNIYLAYPSLVARITQSERIISIELISLVRKMFVVYLRSSFRGFSAVRVVLLVLISTLVFAGRAKERLCRRRSLTRPLIALGDTVFFFSTTTCGL